MTLRPDVLKTFAGCGRRAVESAPTPPPRAPNGDEDLNILPAARPALDAVSSAREAEDVLLVETEAPPVSPPMYAP